MVHGRLYLIFNVSCCAFYYVIPAIFSHICFIPMTFEAITYSTVSLKSDDSGLSRGAPVASLDFSSGIPT